MIKFVKKNSAKAFKIFLIFSLCISWFLTGEPEVPFTEFPPKIKEVKAATQCVTSGTTWSVPADWDDANNTIEVVGGGGAGGSTGSLGSGGGGGGAYAKVTNINMPEGTTVTISLALGGISGLRDGGNTWICNSTSSCANYTDTNVVASAKGGTNGVGGITSTGGAGGDVSGVGTTEFAGGTGGDGVGATNSGGGGGGAGGPLGPGAIGGNGDTNSGGQDGGGGGGGNSGGGAGGNGGVNGGAGGLNFGGGGSGAGGNGSDGSPGSNGGGGGGGDDGWGGGLGGDGTDINASCGSGGGGGGKGNSTSGDNGGAGGLYGGGGGGGVLGGQGKQGLIFITYTPKTPTLNQSAYRWRNDNGTESTATWKNTENNTITGVSLTEVFRLRVEVEETNGGTSTVNARLEFSSDATSCTNGTWTALNVDTTAWIVANSTNITNGDPTTDQLTTSVKTFLAGRIFDSQNDDATGVSLNNKNSEWEWAIQSLTASQGTTYRFRVTDAGTALNNYTNCAQLTTASTSSPTYTQNHYRWYVNPGTPSENVTDPWSANAGIDIAEDTGLTITPFAYDPPDPAQELRLRVNLTVAAANLSASTDRFKLQYRRGSDSDCSATGEGWTDVNTGNAWVYTSQTGVTDGTTLTASKLTGTNILESYVRARPSVLNPNSATTTQNIEYDFHILGTGSASSTRYLFRVVKTDTAGTGTTALTAYTNCAILITEPGTDDIMRHGNTINEFAGEGGFYWAD